MKRVYIFIVTKAGGKISGWITILGKRKILALGVYPETSLKEAREKRGTSRAKDTDLDKQGK